MISEYKTPANADQSEVVSSVMHCRSLKRLPYCHCCTLPSSVPIHNSCPVKSVLFMCQNNLLFVEEVACSPPAVLCFGFLGSCFTYRSGRASASTRGSPLSTCPGTCLALPTAAHLLTLGSRRTLNSCTGHFGSKRQLDSTHEKTTLDPKWRPVSAVGPVVMRLPW